MTMPGDITFNSETTYFGQNLTDSVHNGTIALARVDDMGALNTCDIVQFINSRFMVYSDTDHCRMVPPAPRRVFFPQDQL